MIEKDDLVKAVHTPLKIAGFKKRSLSWYLNGKDTIVVANLQRGFGKNYYINIGIWLKALGDELFPKEYQCHMNWRLERMFPTERELIITSCDLELSNADLLSRLQVFFESRVIPFLLECLDEGKIKSQILDGSIINKKMLRRVEPQDIISLGRANLSNVNYLAQQKCAQQSVHPTLGILARFQAFFYALSFFQLDDVPPPAPARVTQTVGRWRKRHRYMLIVQ